MTEPNDQLLYAEDRPYWATTVQPSKSLGELMACLAKFGIYKHEVRQGQVYGEVAWLIRFQLHGRSHRFVFTPRPCRDPDTVRSFGGVRRSHARQAIFQMGRTAFHFVKNVLAAAEDQPAALFGFVELPGVFHAIGLPATAADIDVSGLTEALPDLEIIPLSLGGHRALPPNDADPGKENGQDVIQ